jgi:hypothetical protein
MFRRGFKLQASPASPSGSRTGASPSKFTVHGTGYPKIEKEVKGNKKRKKNA